MIVLPTVERTVDGPRAIPDGAAELEKLLEILEDTAASAGVPASSTLMPGISGNEVRAQLQSVGLVANDELLAWFGWHNGQNRTANGDGLKCPWALPGSPLASVEEAVERYRRDQFESSRLRDPIGAPVSLAEYRKGLGLGWLQLLDDNYSFAVDCSGPPDASPLLRQAADGWEDFGDRLRARSLVTMVTWWIESIDNGANTWDKSTEQWSPTELSKAPATRIEAAFF